MEIKSFDDLLSYPVEWKGVSMFESPERFTEQKSKFFLEYPNAKEFMVFYLDKSKQDNFVLECAWFKDDGDRIEPPSWWKYEMIASRAKLYANELRTGEKEDSLYSLSEKDREALLRAFHAFHAAK